ncbi:MAG TPA: hypothetical protein VGV13_09905 [Methylomirabilota bacterium]|jgi:hypothetical protein|nr:hypothetical protein [Methylomirabilota bacterium]
MAALAQYALPGIIVVSALGAFIMCLQVFRYGFTAGGDEDLDDASHRLFVTRFAHALAAVCFATAAMLAVIAVKAQAPAASPPLAAAGSAVAPPANTGEVAALREDVRRLEERLNRELAALEERLTSAEGAATRARVEPRAEREEASSLPARARPAPRAPGRGRETPAPRPGPVDRETASALPADVSAHQLRATVQGVHVDVQSRPGHGPETVYTIRLSDSTDRPLTGAAVTLHGQMADGATVGTPLGPGPEPGVYRGRVMMTAEGPRDLRLRVVQHDRRFELSLAHAVSW